MNSRARQRGFTFLELILAMTLVSLLALSLYTSLRAGIKSRNDAIDSVSPIRAAEVAMEMIRRDLESALPPTGYLAGQNQNSLIQIQGSIGFVGMHSSDSSSSADMLQFYCVGEGPDISLASGYFDQTRQGGIRKVRIYVTTLPDGTGGVLVRDITSNLLSNMDIAPDQEVLCRNVRSFSLQYWDNFSGMWQEEWDSTQLGNALPTAVQVTLDVQVPDKYSTGPRIYRTSRIYSLSCYFDPSQGSVTTLTDSTSGTATAGATTGGGTGSAGGNRTGSGATGGGTSGAGATGGGLGTGGAGGSRGGR